MIDGGISSGDVETLNIRLGTRASKLAMWQANWTKHQLEELGHQVQIVQITTEGDTSKESLNLIGGQGVFTKGIQEALLNREIDLAVHSLKDLPTAKIDDLTIAAVPERESTFDVFVSNEFDSLEDVQTGAAIGTGSVRRAAQLKHYRNDLNIKDIRGNVDTRLKKLDAGQYDAIVLAEAGLTRLGLHARVKQRLNQDWMLPAIGQGALGLETRSDDSETVAAVAQLSNTSAFQSVMGERAMLRKLEAGCMAPVGCLSKVEGNQLELTGVILWQEGAIRIEATRSGDLVDAETIGEQLAEKLVAEAEQKNLPQFWK